MKDYTPIVDNIQIRDVISLALSKPNKYDVVRWENTEPYYSTNADGQMQINMRHCYSLAFIIIDEERHKAIIEPIADRLLEYPLSAAASKMVMDFIAERVSYE